MQNLTKKHIMQVMAGMAVLGEETEQFRKEWREMESEDVYASSHSLFKQAGNLLALAIDF